MHPGFCRFTSVASLETLGQAYKQGTELVGLYYDAFFTETKLATDPRALAEAEEGVLLLEKDLLIKKVAQPLSEPPLTNTRDACKYLYGIYHTQHRVHVSVLLHYHKSCVIVASRERSVA